MQTLALARTVRINAIISNPQHGRIFQKYRHEFKSNMKFISDCGIDLNFQKGIKMSLAGDFDALYCQGEITDRWTNPEYDDGTGKSVAERMELIRQGLEEIRSHGKPAGIGAHRIEAIKVCVEHGLKPISGLKHATAIVTGHRKPKRNGMITCSILIRKNDQFHVRTQRAMDMLSKCWLPVQLNLKKALNYAFTNGADFICLGMYDFQIVEDVNIALDTLGTLPTASGHGWPDINMALSLIILLKKSIIISV